MANITISNLHFDGSDLFLDSEGFMNDLSEDELITNYGGSTGLCIVGGLFLFGAGILVGKKLFE